MSHRDRFLDASLTNIKIEPGSSSNASTYHSISYVCQCISRSCTSESFCLFVDFIRSAGQILEAHRLIILLFADSICLLSQIPGSTLANHFAFLLTLYACQAKFWKRTGESFCLLLTLYACQAKSWKRTGDSFCLFADFICLSVQILKHESEG